MGIFNDKNINDKKAFFIGKVISTNKMTLTDKEEITVGNYNTAKVLNASFSLPVTFTHLQQWGSLKELRNHDGELFFYPPQK